MSRPEPRLIDAMPRPLLVLFALGAVTAVAIVVVLLARPPAFQTVPVEQRRPPPRGTLSHDVVRIFPPPPPVTPGAYEPPCDAVAEVRPVGGAPGVGRLTAALGLVCTVAGPGVPDVLGEAVRGLRGARIAFADFRRTGAESTADVGARTIWLNVKLSARDRPVRDLVPVILHEAWHLARAGVAVTASEEYRARTVELEACRQVISRAEWPRWCEDAAAIVAPGEQRAAGALARAGYER